MSNSAITKHFDRPEVVVDTTTVFDESGVISGPSFNLGVKQSLETTIQIDWNNFTGDIEIQFYGRATPKMNFMPMRFKDCDGLLVDRLPISGIIGSDLIHINRKFNDIDVRFVVNSGQANVNVSVLVE
jgi:hypothetical protein